MPTGLRLIAPLLALALFFSMRAFAWSFEASIAAAVTLLCAIWWIFETLPIAATALLPIALFPLFGVLPASAVAQAYGNPVVLLILAGFILSAAMEHSQVHRRLAINMLTLTGGRSGWPLVVGFMLAAASLSMWISNTATALMLLPIALAILQQVKDERLATAVMLGIAYACSLGGMATPIGSPTNLVFVQVYQQSTGQQVGFTHWMVLALPVTLIMLPIVAWWLCRRLRPSAPFDLPNTGTWRSAEKRVLLIFGLLALAWITRQEPFGGWSELLGLPTANDASVGLVAALLLFIGRDREKQPLLSWQRVQQIPWGILILFGSGICIASAFQQTGLSQAIGEQLANLIVLPLWLTLLLLCLCVSFLTEVTSNAATAVLLMPILAATGMAAGIDPALLMLPAVLSCSCAFMLPVATPPNAVAYSSQLFSIRQMARVGLVLNCVGALVISTVFYVRLG